MIDIEKFICSLLADHPEGITVRGDIHRALKEQGLEYKGGKIVPIEDNTELKEDEEIRKELIDFVKSRLAGFPQCEKFIAWLEKQVSPEDKGEISDGYHTFNELYYYRMLYNAAFFNSLPKPWVHKSKKHHDGEECFGGGWFIVMANLPTGQISNHYELKDWELFQIPEKEVADEWDGHTPKEAAERLHKYLLRQREQELLCDRCRKEHPDSSCQELIEFGSCAIELKQIQANKVNAKFKVGEWIITPENKVLQITSIEGTTYRFNHESHYWETYYCDKQCRLWTIQDAKDGDILACGDEVTDCPFIFHDLNENSNPRSYCGINTLDQFQVNDENGGFWSCANGVRPATKEQYDLLFQKMKDDGYKWDSESKELIKIEQV